MAISASRLYATKRQRGVRLLGPPHGTWAAGVSTRDNRGAQNHWRFVAATTATLGGIVNNNNGSTILTGTNTANEDILAYTWITPRLSAGAYTGLTLQLCLRATLAALQSVAGVFKVHVWLTDGSATLPLKQTLLDNYVDSTPWSTTNRYHCLSSAQALTDFTAAEGDRIVIEVGGRLQPDSGADNAFYLAAGTCDGSNVVLPDAVSEDVNLQRAGWFEFNTTLSFVDDDRAAAPSNTSCATAIDITGSLPYQIEGYDTTGAPDAEVWWTFVAPADGRVIVDTLGSAAGWIDLSTRRGTCAGLVFLDDINQASWFGLGQATADVLATAGTQYFIRLREVNPTGNTLAARGSGGAISLRVAYVGVPQSGDLFIDCLHLACFRPGGTLLILQPDFFYGGFGPPTGNAIDYSGLALADQGAGGATHTAHRLYVGFFQGDESFIAILDLATLNLGRAEIDDISTPLIPGENIASLVLTQGHELVVGWFGDNYDIIGQLATPGTYEPSVLNQTHADNQAGAPWPAADTLPVAQDVGGSDFVDATSDGSVVFYTSSGTKVKRWSRTLNQQLPDFATVPTAPGPRPGTRGLRLFPPGDGSGGLLVANGSNVVRLNAAGQVVRTYTPTPASRAQDLDKVEFNETATQFWVSDQLSTSVFRFDVATGAQLEEIRTFLPAGQLCGFSVYHGYRTGLPPPPAGAIIVVKVTVPPGAAQVFSFLADGGLVPETFTLLDGQSRSFLNLPVGAGYAVVEVPVDGWTTAYSVSNGSPIDNLSVGAGETVIVTVTNTAGTILVPPKGFGCPVELPLATGPRDPGCAIPFFP